jgi:soluble lytic murein transglycosylase
MKPTAPLLAALSLPIMAAVGGGTPADRGPAEEARDPLLPKNSVTAPEDTTGWIGDLQRGRFWHAAMTVRTQGAGAPMAIADQLLLAQAEAGWENWEAVIELLEGREWLARHDSGHGLYLLARAFEGVERTNDAVTQYQRFVDVASLGDYRVEVARIRAARLLAESDRTPDAVRLLGRLTPNAAELPSWSALEVARNRAEAGDVAAVELLLPLITDAEAAHRKWERLPRAYVQSNDPAGALRAYDDILPRLDRLPARARAWSAIGELRRQVGDTAGARDAFLNSLEIADSGLAAAIASEGILRLGTDSRDVALALAERLASADRVDQALEAYALHERLSGGPAGTSESVRLHRARLLIRDRSLDRAADLLAALTSSADPGTAAEALEHLLRVRRSQRRSADVDRLEAELVERFPERPRAVEIVFLEADALHDEGRLDEAVAFYARAVAMAPTADGAELSRMRIGQIRITQGDFPAAAEVFEAHLAEVPEGDAAAEAAYWAAWSRLRMGDPDRAREHLGAVMALSPLSYYAVQTAHLLGVPYGVPVEPGGAPLPPVWLTDGLRRIDLLRDANLAYSERALVDRLTERARQRDDHLLLLAKGLHERGWNWEAINLGWEVRRRGRPFDRLLLEVLYPFPFREMVMREAQEWNVDPYLIAGMIRQESAWWPRARSGADARGLMQVLPATGERLSRSIGPSRFTPSVLYNADVNLHLGTAYLWDMLQRYENDIPLVLSAYNAGPTRATRWRRFPEASDPVRFTERIPFRETRGYVKNVTRNRELYAFLYGSPEGGVSGP